MLDSAKSHTQPNSNDLFVLRLYISSNFPDGLNQTRLPARWRKSGVSCRDPFYYPSVRPPLSDQALSKDLAEIEHAVITNSTVFYMQGGGQPSDTGTMAQIVTSSGPAANPDLIFRVESIHQPAQGSQILHLGCFVPSLAPPATGFNPGSQV